MFPSSGRCGALALLLALLLCPRSPHGQEIPLEQAWDNFGQPAPAPGEDQALVPAADNPWRLGGRLEAQAALAPRSHQAPSAIDDSRGLTSLRGRLDLAAEGELAAGWRARAALHAWHDAVYALRGDDHFRPQQRDDQQQELELDEFWLEGDLAPRLHLRLGRQILAWSSCDLFRPADAFNAKDQREPGLADGREALLPSGIVRADVQAGSWRWQIVSQPEPRFDRYPPYGSDYYPFDFPLPPRQHSSLGLDATGWGLRAARDLGGWDLALHGASTVQEQDLVGLAPEVAERPLLRLVQGGLSSTLVSGAWVAKWDGILVHGLEYYQLPHERKTRLDLVLGGDYAGWRDSSFTAELLYRHLFGLESGTDDNLNLPAPDVLGLALRYSRKFFHERLRLSLGSYLFGLLGSHGGLVRASGSWALSDTLSLQAAVVVLLDGDNYIFQHLDGTDRLFLRLRRTF